MEIFEDQRHGQPHARPDDDVEQHRERHHAPQKQSLTAVEIKEPYEKPRHDAAQQSVDDGYDKFFLNQIRLVGFGHLSHRHGPYQKRQRLITGIAGHARHHGHQRRQCHHALNRTVKGCNDAGRKKCRTKVHAEPQPAAFGRVPHAAENILIVIQTDGSVCVFVAFFTNDVHHFVHGETSHEAPGLINHGRAHEVVTFESLRRIARIVQGI